MINIKELINKPRNELNDKEKFILFIIDILLAPIILIICFIAMLPLLYLFSLLMTQI